MITYTAMTPSQTFEERIVSVINTGIEPTATKVVCITNGNLLRYKTLPQATIVSFTYSGVFSSATTNEIITFNLPTGIVSRRITGTERKCRSFAMYIKRAVDSETGSIGWLKSSVAIGETSAIAVTRRAITSIDISGRLVP